MNLPKRFQLKALAPKDGGKAAELLVYFVAFFFGPLALLLAVKKGGLSATRAVSGWIAGWVVAAVAIAIAIGVHNLNDDKMLEQTRLKRLATLKANRSEWEQSQTIKMQEHKRREFDALKLAFDQAMELRRSINNILGGRKFSSFTRIQAEPVVGSECAAVEDLSLRISVTMEGNTTAQIVAERLKAEKDVEWLQKKLEVLEDALEKFKLKLVQDRLRKYAVDKISELSLEAVLGRNIGIHTFLEGSVDEVRIAEELARLQELQTNPLAFLNAADAICNEDHKRMDLYPFEATVDEILADLQQIRFRFNLVFKDSVDAVCVQVQDDPESPLVEARPTFSIDGRNKVYIIEAGAFEYLTKKLLAAREKGENVRKTFLDMMGQSKTYDEVAWRRRQKEMAERRRREAAEAAESERQRRDAQNRDKASKLRSQISDTESRISSLPARWQGATATDIATGNRLKKKLNELKSELKRLERQGY